MFFPYSLFLDTISFFRKSFSLNCREKSNYLSHDLEITKPTSGSYKCLEERDYKKNNLVEFW